MKLNHDCIRDIMLYVEEHTDSHLDTVELKEILKEYPQYNIDTLKYHSSQLHDAHFISRLDLYPNNGMLGKLTWSGHEYIDNIRDKTAWQMIKEGAFDLSSMSLNMVGQLSKELIFSYAKKKFGLS